MTDATSTSRVELAIPAAVEWLALARTTGAAVATRLKFNYDEITDLRLAIDELCLTLVEGKSASRLELLFESDGSTLTVEGRAIAAGDDATALPLDGRVGGDVVLSADLSARILDALVDAHGQDEQGETRRAWLKKQRTAPGA
jgi:hypothetical protein